MGGIVPASTGRRNICAPGDGEVRRNKKKVHEFKKQNNKAIMKKFIISSAVLKKMLHKLSNAILAKPVLPVLANVWCKVTEGSIELIVSDLEVTIFYRQPCETTGEGFEFFMPFDLIQKIVALNMNCPLSFSLEKKGIKITSEKGVYELKSSFKIEDFPKLQLVPKKISMPIPAEFVYFLTTALATVGTDEQRPECMKVLLELTDKETTIASTDGSFCVFSYTMAVPAPAKEDIVISPKVIKALSGIEDMNLYWNAKVYAFESKEVTIIVTRPDLKFKNFRAIFPPDYPSNLTVSHKEIVRALENCSISNDPMNEARIYFKKQKGQIVFIAKDPGSGININYEVEGDYTGEVNSISFSFSLMLKLMKQIDFENVEIASHLDEKGNEKAIVFRSPDNPCYLGLLMPLQKVD